MAEALPVKLEEAFAGDAEMFALRRVGVDGIGLKFAADDEVVDGLARDGQELRHFTHFEQERNVLFYRWFEECCHKIGFEVSTRCFC